MRRRLLGNRKSNWGGISPTSSDWNEVNNLNVATTGEVHLVTYNQAGNTAVWFTQPFIASNDWEFRIKYKKTPTGIYSGNSNYGYHDIILRKISDGTEIIKMSFYSNGAKTSVSTNLVTPTDSKYYPTLIPSPNTEVEMNQVMENLDFRVKWINGVLYVYNGKVLKFTSSYVIVDDLELVTKIRYYDLREIKFKEL